MQRHFCRFRCVLEYFFPQKCLDKLLSERLSPGGVKFCDAIRQRRQGCLRASHNVFKALSYGRDLAADGPQRVMRSHGHPARAPWRRKAKACRPAWIGNERRFLSMCSECLRKHNRCALKATASSTARYGYEAQKTGGQNFSTKIFPQIDFSQKP